MPIGMTTWQRGLDTQSACNLSGLTHWLLELLAGLRASGVNDTDALNTHPLVRLVVAQMAHLAYGSFDCGAGNKWQRAYQLAEMETGRSPYQNRPLEPGEREQIEAAWMEEDREESTRTKGVSQEEWIRG
jgi:hypothetical protein